MYSLECISYDVNQLIMVGRKFEVLKEVKSLFMRGFDFRLMYVKGWSNGKSNFHVSGKGCGTVEYFLMMIGE